MGNGSEGNPCGDFAIATSESIHLREIYTDYSLAIGIADASAFAGVRGAF